MTCPDHIFEILDITSREDSYTSLIKTAFNYDALFRRNFLSLLGADPSIQWEAEMRKAVFSAIGAKSRKDIPDLILRSCSSNEAYVLENKVFAGEGIEQTNRYASDEFKKALKKKFGTTDIHYFFLALDPETRPNDATFSSINLQEIFQLQSSIDPSSKIGVLMEEAKLRITEYVDLAPPQPDEKILSYMQAANFHLLTPHRAFQVLTRDLVASHSLTHTYFGLTNNPGSGTIPLRLWAKPAWIGKPFDAPNSRGKACFNLHFELQFFEREKKFVLFLHHETEPYLPRKRFETLSPDFCESHLEARARRVELIRSNLPRYWNQSYPSWLKLAHREFHEPEVVTYSSFKAQIERIIRETIPVIDGAIANIEQPVAA